MLAGGEFSCRAEIALCSPQSVSSQTAAPPPLLLPLPLLLHSHRRHPHACDWIASRFLRCNGHCSWLSNDSWYPGDSSSTRESCWITLISSFTFGTPSSCLMTDLGSYLLRQDRNVRHCRIVLQLPPMLGFALTPHWSCGYCGGPL